MKAWGDQLDPAHDTQIRFLGDPAAEFTKALNLEWDATGPFGGVRGKRYALKVEDGKVKEAHVEPDNAGFNGKWRSIILCPSIAKLTFGNRSLGCQQGPVIESVVRNGAGCAEDCRYMHQVLTECNADGTGGPASHQKVSWSAIGMI
jgi:hypothetical protein